MMKKLAVLALTLLILPTVAYALDFSSITDFFSWITSWFTAECNPDIVEISVDPVKVEPSHTMTVTAEITCAQEAYAYVAHEKGMDEVRMQLVAGKWQASWQEHDLKNEKWYEGFVLAKYGDKVAKESFTYTDPTQSHPASEITAGTFDAGNFVFPQNLNITNNLTVGSRVGIGTTNPTEKLEVSGNLKVTGNISSSETPMCRLQTSSCSGDYPKSGGYIHVQTWHDYSDHDGAIQVATYPAYGSNQDARHINFGAQSSYDIVNSYDIYLCCR